MLNHKRQNAFTIIELLIALAISSLLLTALAVAFNASVINYTENEDIFKAVNQARQALFRITTELRTAAAVDPNTPANECTMITAQGQDITYRYVSGDQTLYLVTNGSTSDPDYTLCENVSAMTFTPETYVEDVGGTPTAFVKSMQISMTVQVDQQIQTISAAAVVRRNLE